MSRRPVISKSSGRFVTVGTPFHLLVVPYSYIGLADFGSGWPVVASDSLALVRRSHTRHQYFSACPASCRCACHDVRHFRMPFKWLFGSLLLGYSATPIGISSCTESSCLGNPARFQGRVEYHCPPWFKAIPSAAIVLELYIAAISGPEKTFHVDMKLRNLVPWGCPLFVAAYSGDVENLKTIVKHRGGLNDQTDDFGTTALAVRIPGIATVIACEQHKV